MTGELEKLIEIKKKNDNKQRRTSLIIISFALILIFSIFYSIMKKQKVNEVLSKTLDTTKINAIKNDSIVKQLKDTLLTVRKEFKKDVIECIGVSTGENSKAGYPMYNFTIRIKDTSLVSELLSVDYYFDDITYHPKLKTSKKSENNFLISIRNCWGCMPIVPVYLHYKNANIDTIQFPMCDKAKITIPKY